MCSVLLARNLAETIIQLCWSTIGDVSRALLGNFSFVIMSYHVSHPGTAVLFSLAFAVSLNIACFSTREVNRTILKVPEIEQKVIHMANPATRAFYVSCIIQQPC